LLSIIGMMKGNEPIIHIHRQAKMPCVMGAMRLCDGQWTAMGILRGIHPSSDFDGAEGGGSWTLVVISVREPCWKKPVALADADAAAEMAMITAIEHDCFIVCEIGICLTST